MTGHDDDQLASWMTIGPQEGPIGAVEDALARARATRQRPAWLVAMTGGTIAAEPGGGVLRAMALAVAVVALAGALLGALVAGGMLPPPFRPDPSALAKETALPSATDQTAEPTPLPTPEPPMGLVAYQLWEPLEPGKGACTDEGTSAHWCQVLRIWISNTDGRDAHALHPDDVRGETFLTWSRDGTRIVYESDGGVRIATIDGHVERTFERDDLCRYPCAGMEGFSISPDGTRLAFVRDSPDAKYSSVITVLDIASGNAVELESTRTTNVAGNLCHESNACEGMNDMPRWSPDGTRIAFARQHMSPEPGSAWSSGAIYVVDPDGTDLQRVTPTGWFAISPSWSSDGTHLAFINVEQTLSDDGFSVDMEHSDVYSIRPNGSDLVRLTNDGNSFGPEWTRDGRIIFARSAPNGEGENYENWIMDADGNNISLLPESLEALTAAGCVSCRYPFSPADGFSRAFWQPTP